MTVELAMVVNGIFSLVTSGLTATFAYKAATRQFSKTTKDSDKSIFVTAVTNERARWRDELRKSVAEFCMLCMEEKPNIPRLQQVKTEITLRLNPRANEPPFSQEHKLDREIMESINELFRAVSQRNRQAIPDLIRKLETSAQEMLKQEWDKSKDEALCGKVHRTLNNALHPTGGP